MDSVFIDKKDRVFVGEIWILFDLVILFNIWNVNLRDGRTDDLSSRLRQEPQIILRISPAKG